MNFHPDTHDLSLPSWGPYTKRYAGISHIPAGEDGLRFDLSVLPGFYRGRTDVPNVLMEGNTHIWEASPDLSYFSMRYELEWKDAVYADAAYARLDDSACLLHTRLVNNGDTMQNLVLHYMASINYPVEAPDDECETITPVRCSRPEKSGFCRGIDYVRFSRAVSLPTDSLVPDGRRPNEKRGAGLTGGSGVLLGKTPGEKAIYSLAELPAFRAPVLVLRYRGGEAELEITGGMNLSAHLPAHPDFETAVFPVGITGESCAFCLTEGSILLDSFVLCEKEEAEAVKYTVEAPAFVPEVWERGAEEPLVLENSYRLPLEQDAQTAFDPERNTLILKYPHTGCYYGIFWDFPDFCLRYLLTGELDVYFRYMIHNHVSKVLFGDEKGHFSDIFLRPIPIPPGGEADLYAAVCCGQSLREVREKLAALAARRGEFPALCAKAREGAFHPGGNPAGERYRFSQERMAATTLTNVVYPVYAKRRYIRHNTPGRWWDCLYTWDSGFVGLGLSTCGVQRAADCLNAYLTEPGDPESAFIHHGSPVPTQFYLFQELWNRTQSPELLVHCFPRLLQYYRFMTGQLGSSTIGKFRSGLLCTWDYFYNSGGWDDYPPQIAVHARRLENAVACCATTSHMIRCAKILRQAAAVLGGQEETAAALSRDIARLSGALQLCWDEESGYFGYLCHDGEKNPAGIFRHPSGTNFNMGLDGASPMIAGEITGAQLSRLAGHLMSEQELWTPIGLSTVDQSAPYYKKDGYWNGAVWMPHQWFFFKALLDYGLCGEAFRIARTALELWAHEVEHSYNCYEHFIIASGRGAGWHQFSGLSCPVLLWYQSYFRPGTITGGLSAWITGQDWSAGFDHLRCAVAFADNRPSCSLIFAMAPGKRYRCAVDGTEFPLAARLDGAVELTLPAKAGQTVRIEISAEE